MTDPADSAARTPSARFGRADLQVHTDHGDGMEDPRAIFERVELRGDLDVIAVTDHDDVRGALRAREIHAQAPGARLSRRGRLANWSLRWSLSGRGSCDEDGNNEHEHDGCSHPHDSRLCSRLHMKHS